MPDTWGALPIPLVAPTGDQPTSDPALGYLLSYLQAFLTTDENATNAWSVAGIAANVPPVRSTFPFNPAEFPWSKASLPALFGWREGGESEQVADDIRVETTQLKLLWVFPEAGIKDNARRSPIANGIVKCVDTAIDRGRTPAWVQPGDVDPMASTAGSFLGTYLQAWQVHFVRWKRAKVAATGDAGQFEFFAIEMVIDLKEDQERDLTRNPPYQPNTGATIAIVDGASGNTVDQGVVTTMGTTWAPATSYIAGALVVPVAPTGFFYRCSTQGTTGASAPPWPVVLGATVVDGTAIWTCAGALPT